MFLSTLCSLQLIIADTFVCVSLSFKINIFEIFSSLNYYDYSLLFGNLYVFFALRGVSIITDVERTQLFIILTAVCAIGTILLCFLRTIKTPYEVLGDLQVDNT